MAEMIAIAKLRRDGGTQPRAMLDPSTVEVYADGVREGASFPPVVVFHDGTNHWLADGFHRTEAHAVAGESEIAADIRPGTQRDAILFACGANATHGLRRTTEDKRRAVILLLLDPEWSGWSDREIAGRAHVSHPFVAKLRDLHGNVSMERKFVSRHGTVAERNFAMDKRAADMATLRSLPVEALHQLVIEQHRARQDKKKARREEREQQLGERIANGNSALVAAGAAGKRYGVILGDPEWPFEVWSALTGMDRSPDNHYPTSPLEVIAARPVQEITAEDCALLLWTTVPHLESGLMVLNRWGFRYRTHWIGHKDRLGTGYWNRNKHEVLLLGIRGDVPAPAMGTQFESVLPFPVREHSRKPDFAHEIAERYWPSLPKIELNAREARPGWDVWGAEAPAPLSGRSASFVIVDEFADQLPALPLRGRAEQPLPFSASSPGEPTCNS